MSAMTIEIRGVRPIFLCVKLISLQTLEGQDVGPLFDADYKHVTKKLSSTQIGCQD